MTMSEMYKKPSLARLQQKLYRNYIKLLFPSISPFLRALAWREALKTTKHARPEKGTNEKRIKRRRYIRIFRRNLAKYCKILPMLSLEWCKIVQISQTHCRWVFFFPASDLNYVAKQSFYLQKSALMQPRTSLSALRIQIIFDQKRETVFVQLVFHLRPCPDLVSFHSDQICSFLFGGFSAQFSLDFRISIGLALAREGVTRW